ncbi:hypothetical protein LZ554_000422 [Drepanopeziza brunnea f. sp. 'monogermtubi']|nr:hypothetical protein LZ554_000422 [Drepanopeziza brunnea f. sp. 'monogermtubi']
MPALQVIVLGSGGGPEEDNVTSFLVRATATCWKRGSILAVDAGVHMSAIKRILDTHKQNRPFDSKDQTSSSIEPVVLTDGPFEGLEIPHISSKANAGYIHRELVQCLLLTHPHLDHCSGFIMNTASLPTARPKRIAGLPDTIEALKTHIFNNVIWPNLSDENNGAGLITYMRLVEGGSVALGEGDSRGYVEVCDGLCVKTLTLSHGHCFERHSHRGSNAGFSPMRSPNISMLERSPRLGPSMLQRNNSLNSGLGESSRTDGRERVCVYESSAYFIRDFATGREVLIFGDVEPDSVSLSPRNHLVWAEAAPKIVSGNLGGILIECSYDNSRADELLFGHMSPHHLIDELKNLAERVAAHREGLASSAKRKRDSNGVLPVLGYPAKVARVISMSPVSPLSAPSRKEFYDPIASPPRDGPSDSKHWPHGTKPLMGFKVVIIHVKENLVDGPNAGEIILKELQELEQVVGLGCEFIMSSSGQSLYF